MLAPPIQLLIGLGLGTLVGGLAWRLRALSPSGGIAAALTGGLIFGLGGLDWALLLLTFFITSSAWSRAFTRRKGSLGEKYAKGSQRDWGQVLANGGLGAALVITSALQPGEAWPWVAYSGAIAAVNADTWATELGVFSPSQPRRILDGKPVEPGTSGGVTGLGYLAALAGAGLIALLAAVFASGGRAPVLILAVILAGLAGSTLDSILGATLQAIYTCPQCVRETERHPLHTCGVLTVQVRGWRWLNNDLVNLFCSLAGAIVACGIWLLFSG